MGSVRTGKKIGGKRISSADDGGCGELLSMKKKNPEKFEKLFKDVDRGDYTGGKVSRRA